MVSSSHRRLGSPEREDVGAAGDVEATVDGAQARPNEPVLGARRERDVELDRACHVLQHPSEDVGTRVSDVVTALASAEQQTVDEHGGSGPGLEPRLEHEGALAIGPLHAAVRARADRPMTRVRVEEPPEGRRGIEAREAQPIDRSRATHQRAAVTVRQERVVSDRQAVQWRVLGRCFRFGHQRRLREVLAPSVAAGQAFADRKTVARQGGREGVGS